MQCNFFISKSSASNVMFVWSAMVGIIYSVEPVLLNKHQSWGGAPKLDRYLTFRIAEFYILQETTTIIIYRKGSAWFMTKIWCRTRCAHRKRCSRGANSRSSSNRSRNGTTTARRWSPQDASSHGDGSVPLDRSSRIFTTGSGDRTRKSVPPPTRIATVISDHLSKLRRRNVSVIRRNDTGPTEQPSFCPINTEDSLLRRKFHLNNNRWWHLALKNQSHQKSW